MEALDIHLYHSDISVKCVECLLFAWKVNLQLKINGQVLHVSMTTEH